MCRRIIFFVLFGLVPGWAQPAEQAEEGFDISAGAFPGGYALAEAEPGEYHPQTSTSFRQVLRLEEAVRMAFSKNPDVPQAVHRIEQAQAGLKAARAAFLPWVGFEANHLQIDYPHVSLAYKADHREMDMALTDFNNPGVIPSYDVGLKGKWNIYNGGADRAAHGMAKRQLNLARLGQQRVRNDLVASIANTLLDITITDELAVAEQVSIESIEAQVRETEARVEAGSALREDVLSLKVGLATAEDALIGAQNAGKLARTALARLLGVDLEDLADYKFAEITPPAVPGEFKAGLAIAKERNPDYRSAQEEMEKVKFGVKAATALFLPTVDLKAKYFLVDDTPGWKLDRADWLVNININFCVFAGGGNQADKKKAEAVQRVGETALKQIGLNVETDVRSAYIRLEGARSRLKVSEAAVENAESGLNLVTQHYQAGAVTVTRFIESEKARTFARVSAIQARIGQMQALIEVARVVGWWTEGKLETQ